MNSLVDKYIGGYDNTEKRKQTVKIYKNGNKYNRVVGEEVEFKIRDILISLRYFDLSNINNKKVLKSIHEAFILTCNKESIQEIFEEIDILLSLSNEEFAQIYSKKFNLQMPFSDVLRPLFMVIKEYFENLIKKMVSPTIDIEKYITKWNNIDKEKNINSSSVILYQLGKDKEFINEIATAGGVMPFNVQFISYITNNEKWSYMGWCPYAPSIRMKHLLNFPLELVFKILEINQRELIDENREFIKKLNIEESLSNLPNAPSVIQINLNILLATKLEQADKKKSKSKRKKITSKIYKRKIKKLILKLNDVKDILLEWEDYYISFAKAYSIISNNFQQKLLEI